jgi:hypothetical protein
MEEFMPEKTSSHIRLPQRAAAVVGPEPQPGARVPRVMLDPRTATQDPALKAKVKLAADPKQPSAK